MANGFCERCGIIGDFRRHLKMEKGRWVCQDKETCDRHLAALEAERRPPEPPEGEEHVEPMPGSS